MSYQREIIKGAGYDAWIAIILPGLRTLMYKTEYVSPGCALKKRTYSN